MEAKQLLLERRSVNFFDKNIELSDSVLKDIINLAVYAPSAFNLQPWRIIAVKSDESKKLLFELSNKQEKVMDAPVTLILIGNKEAYADSNPEWSEIQKSLGGDISKVEGLKKAAAFLYGSTEERKIKFASSNVGLLAMSIMISAKEFGLDSHPMSGLDYDGIHDKFELTDDEYVVMTIAIGYFDTKKQLYPRRPRRLFDDIAKII